MYHCVCEYTERESMYTEKDCEMLIDLAKGLVVAQGTEESGNEILPFFMAAGKCAKRNG